MATISLFASKVNGMPGMIRDVKSSVKELKAEIFNLRVKSLTVNKSICDMDDVISSITAATQVQEDKVEALETFRQNSEQFISDTARVDGDVADRVNENKDDFYDKYYYLKPECEKSGWEKFCDGCEKAWEWCKENWVKIVTVVVVVAIAVVAALCHVAIAAIAAIAGVIALVLCVVDVICMFATGKDIATHCNENGCKWLGQIFEGVSFGCDVVSIVFPIGAAVKTAARVGVRQFAKTAFSALKTSFKETCELLWKKGFKTSFKEGMKNLGKVAFKTFIFDIDDVSRLDDGKRVWNLMESSIDMRGPTQNWDRPDGESVLYPKDSVIPGHSNPDKLTMKEILNNYGADSIPVGKDGMPDLSSLSVKTVPIDMRTANFDVDGVLSGEISGKEFGDLLRQHNFDMADLNLLEPQKIADYKQALRQGDDATAKRILKEAHNAFKQLEAQTGFRLTRHEDFNMKTVYYVPTQIHANIGHTGAIGNYKFNFFKIPDLANLVESKFTEWVSRFSLEKYAESR